MSNFMVWGLIAMVVTGAISASLNIWQKPSGFKTGTICAIAFTIGAMSSNIQIF